MSDCIVVGGGLIGMLSARMLKAAGLSVKLVESGLTGRRSSWAGGGILAPIYPWRYPDAVNILVDVTARAFPSLAAELHSETGIDPEHVSSGMLILDEGLRDLAMKWAEGRWSAPIRWMSDSGAVHELEPALGGRHDDVIWMPEVSQVRNPRLLKAMRASLDCRSIPVLENQEVLGIETRNGRVAGVRTADMNLGADRVVVCCGAWSAGLLASFGRVPIGPVRGQMILFKGPPGLLRHIVLHRGRYLIPRSDGRILAGSTLEHVGFDCSTTQEAISALRQEACDMVPSLADLTVEHHWAGLRPGSPQGIPLISAHPGIDGLFVNAGHFRNGIASSIASCQLLRDLVAQRRSEFDPAPYRMV